MKELLAGIVLILVLGIAGFVYRNTLEHSSVPVPAGPTGVACTTEAKLCPDGTAVGRTGADCHFAPCALPNVEIADAHLAFAIPAGYAADENAVGADPTFLAAFVHPVASTNALSTLEVRDYPIAPGSTATSTMLAHTTLGASGLPGKLSDFKSVVIGGKTYQEVQLERFEGIVHTAYYLPRTTDVLRFEVIEQDVQNWTDPKLDVEALPAHQALRALLGTLQLTGS